MQKMNPTQVTILWYFVFSNFAFAPVIDMDFRNLLNSLGYYFVESYSNYGIFTPHKYTIKSFLA
jgi:hypothetical protein